MNRETLLSPDVVEQFQAHAKSVYPNEAIGYISDEGYVPLENTSSHPRSSARHASPVLRELRDAGKLLALYHSHTNGRNYPSSQDMRTQLSWAIPFVLSSTNGDDCLPPVAWGDQLEPLPIVGRGFVHGIADCYELVRDLFYSQKGVRLKQFPRDWEWWNTELDLFTMGFAQAGFRRISATDLSAGDGILFSVRSPSRKVNHAGVYLGDDVMIHHATTHDGYSPGNLSRRVSMSRYLPHAVSVVRWEPC